MRAFHTNAHFEDKILNKMVNLQESATYHFVQGKSFN